MRQPSAAMRKAAALALPAVRTVNPPQQAAFVRTLPPLRGGRISGRSHISTPWAVPAARQLFTTATSIAEQAPPPPLAPGQYSHEKPKEELQQQEPWQCPNCGASHDFFTFLCHACGSVMEANYSGTTHFSVLGLHPKFDINTAEAEAAYKQLQRQLHPDRHMQASEKQAELAAQHSARLNEAMSVLRSPLKRAGHWMELNGCTVLAEEQRMSDAETMMEVMETHEEIEAATTQEEIDQLAEQVLTKVRSVEVKLSGAFQEEDWESAKKLIERLQLLCRLKDQLSDWKGP